MTKQAVPVGGWLPEVAAALFQPYRREELGKDRKLRDRMVVMLHLAMNVWTTDGAVELTGGREALAYQCGMSVSTVHDCIKDLERAGMIHVINRGDGSRRGIFLAEPKDWPPSDEEVERKAVARIVTERRGSAGAYGGAVIDLDNPTAKPDLSFKTIRNTTV